MIDWIKNKIAAFLAGGYLGSLIRKIVLIGVVYLVSSGKLEQVQADTFMASIDPVIQAAIAVAITWLISWVDRAKRNAAEPLVVK